MTAELRRSMGLSHATALVVGTIVGASIFVQPSEVSQHVPTIGGMMLVWVLAGLLTCCGALVCAELAAVFPQSGGVYVFLKESYSPALGFLWGWAMFWSIHSGIIAAMSVIFARYAGHFAGLDDTGTRGVAIAGILLLSAVNYAGVRLGSVVQLVFTGAKLGGIALILILFFALGSGAPEAASVEAAGDFSIDAIVLALTAALFTFGGWHMVTYTAGETRDAEKTIPRALLIGTLIVAGCYLALNAAYLWVLPLEQMIESTRVAGDAAQILLGRGGGGAIAALVVVSTFGALNGIILMGPRVYHAMAQDGLAFRWMGALHPRYDTPHWAIVAQAAWASVLVATDTYRNLFTRVIYTEWLFFALLALAVFRLRRTAGYSPRFVTRGYPVVALLFVGASLMIVVTQVRANPQGSTLGLLLVVLGLPVYFLWRRARQGAMDVHH